MQCKSSFQIELTCFKTVHVHHFARWLSWQEGGGAGQSWFLQETPCAKDGYIYPHHHQNKKKRLPQYKPQFGKTDTNHPFSWLTSQRERNKLPSSGLSLQLNWWAKAILTTLTFLPKILSLDTWSFLGEIFPSCKNIGEKNKDMKYNGHCSGGVIKKVCIILEKKQRYEVQWSL